MLQYISSDYFAFLTNYLPRGDSKRLLESEIFGKMALVTILALLVNLVIIQGKTEVGPEEALRADVQFDVYASAIAKAHYNPWFCNYFKEPGYKCTSCSSALHCYPGNFALLVQCAGRLPYCSNGYCSATKAERCIEEPSKFKIPATTEPNKVTEINEEHTTPTLNADDKKEVRRLF